MTISALSKKKMIPKTNNIKLANKKPIPISLSLQNKTEYYSTILLLSSNANANIVAGFLSFFF